MRFSFAPCFALATLIGASALFADEPAPAAKPAAPVAAQPAARVDFTGLMIMGKENRFLLVAPGGEHSGWLTPGDSFAGWTVDSYSDKDGMLVVKNAAGKTLELKIADSHVTPGEQKATLADGMAVLEKMNFSAMFDKMMAQQKVMAQNMAKQISAQMGARGGASPDTVAQAQKEAMDIVMGALDSKQMEQDMAQVYSDTFTKDELDGMASFYETPAGQALIEKTPDVQAKMQQLIMPRIMAVMPQVQALAQKYQQGAAAGQGPAAPAPAPK